ncbi:hypothetical protein PAHAL_4G047000 [Panicum hallii]|uniref:Uncharacterized protein n=1 Tax=Panicum hallii TaxID=206008 RepID=A0A2S3HH45_9POAL|nr:hypothetical protein PAHAL_4G047000 [Panicum hallii]
MAYVPQADHPESIEPPRLDHVQRRHLRAGRILVAGGWLVLTYTTNSGRRGNAEHAIAGLALLLLGVFLVVLSPVARQFPGAARPGAAAADTVLFYFFAAGN